MMLSPDVPVSRSLSAVPLTVQAPARSKNVVFSTDELLDGVGSTVALVADGELSTGPACSPRASIVTVAESPLFSDPIVHTTVGSPAQIPTSTLADSSDSSAGS